VLLKTPVFWDVKLCLELELPLKLPLELLLEVPLEVPLHRRTGHRKHYVRTVVQYVQTWCSANILLLCEPKGSDFVFERFCWF
jgi:hypothetical protein